MRHDLLGCVKRIREHREQLETARAVLRAEEQRMATIRQFSVWAREHSDTLDSLTGDQRRKILKSLNTTVVIASKDDREHAA